MTKVYLCYSLLTPKYLQPIANPNKLTMKVKARKIK